MIACRACKVALTAQTGCAICDPIRRNLVVTEEDDGERPSLAVVGNEVVAGLRAQLKHIKALLKTDPDDPAGNRLIAIGNTLAKVLEAARKLQADGKSAVEAMSFQERLELFVGWFAELPPAYRVSLRAKLDEFESAKAAPLSEQELNGN